MKKKSTLIIASFVLCAVLIAGVTLAYLTAASNVKTNTFTISEDISIQLAENKWDNLGYDGNPITGESAIAEADRGITKAQNVVPGRVIPKNPSIKNTSDQDVWVAIKLEYTGDTGGVSNYAAVDAFATINWLSGNWEPKDDSKTVFYYNTKVAAGHNTSELFDKVTIDNVSYSALKPFNIVIKGYAVQGEGLTLDQAKTELDALILATP